VPFEHFISSEREYVAFDIFKRGYFVISTVTVLGSEGPAHGNVRAMGNIRYLGDWDWGEFA
jgi:hypothetical protein